MKRNYLIHVVTTASLGACLFTILDLVGLSSNIAAALTGIATGSLAVMFISFIKLLPNIMKRSKIIQKYTKLSIVGIMQERKANETKKTTITLLIVLTIYLMLPHFINYTLNYFVIFVCTLLIVILSVGKCIFDYRLRHGFYGNNEREAREIIQFIIEESSNIDFTDGDKLKSIINNEDLKEIKHVVFKVRPGIVITN